MQCWLNSSLITQLTSWNCVKWIRNKRVNVAFSGSVLLNVTSPQWCFCIVSAKKDVDESEGRRLYFGLHTFISVFWFGILYVFDFIFGCACVCVWDLFGERRGRRFSVRRRHSLAVCFLFLEMIFLMKKRLRGHHNGNAVFIVSINGNLIMFCLVNEIRSLTTQDTIIKGSKQSFRWCKIWCKTFTNNEKLSPRHTLPNVLTHLFKGKLCIVTHRTFSHEISLKIYHRKYPKIS